MEKFGNNHEEVGPESTAVSEEAMQVKNRHRLKYFIDNDQNVNFAFCQMKVFRIDVEPLWTRLLNEPDLQPQCIIEHVLEYMAAIMESIELQDMGVSILAVHHQQSLSNAAVDTAKRVISGKAYFSRETLGKFITWLENNMERHKLINAYIDRLK